MVDMDEDDEERALAAETQDDDDDIFADEPTGVWDFLGFGVSVCSSKISGSIVVGVVIIDVPLTGVSNFGE